MVLRLRASSASPAKDRRPGWIWAAARAHPRQAAAVLGAAAGLLTVLAWLTSLGCFADRFGDRGQARRLVGHMQFWQQVADTFKGFG